MFDKILWVEKYRPKELKDLALQDTTKENIELWFENGEIPQVLFSGPPGSGKTATARIVVSNVIKDQLDLLMLNGSEQRGIQVVRDIIIPFVKSPPVKSKYKIVFIDEADYLTDENQSALRSLIEQVSSNARFLFTCNYLSKIIEPLQSRFRIFKFSSFPKQEVLKFLKDILDKEQVKYTDDQLKILIDMYYPDARKIIDTMEMYSINKQLTIKGAQTIISKEQTVVEKVIELVNKKDMNSVSWLIKEMNNEDLDFKYIYEGLFKDERLSVEHKMLVCRYASTHTSTISVIMNFGSLIYDIIRAGSNNE